MSFFHKENEVSKEKVAKIIEDFLNNQGGEWDWDDFISLPIKNEELDNIRLRVANLRTEFPPSTKGQYCNEQGLQVLRDYVQSLRESK